MRPVRNSQGPCGHTSPLPRPPSSEFLVHELNISSISALIVRTHKRAAPGEIGVKVMGSLYKRGKKWGIDYRDHRGKRMRELISGDKSVAQQVLAKRIQSTERIKHGIWATDPLEAERPLAEHIAAYLQDLARRGRDDMYRYSVGKRLERAAREGDWRCLRDITPASVTKCLWNLTEEGLHPKTVNDYRAHVSAFLNWCKRVGHIEQNVCDRVSKSAVKTEKTRRALSPHECRALLEASPPQRRIVYLFLMYTGLRRSEAAGLCWHHVRLDVMNPFVEIPPTLAKSGRHETVPLTREVAAALERHRGDVQPGDLVFDEIPSMPVFREDLSSAQIDEVDSRGRKVVLHCLRHSLATMLANANVPLAVAQRIMRHRDIKLTAEVYCDEGLLPMTSAMATLPTMGVEIECGREEGDRRAEAS